MNANKKRLIQVINKLHNKRQLLVNKSNASKNIDDVNNICNLDVLISNYKRLLDIKYNRI